MAIQTKAIKQKINSIGNLKKVTKTMELISIAKMRKMISFVKERESYSTAILRLLNNLSRERHLEHPFLKEGKGKKHLVVLFTSDRGLCGQYHVRLNDSVKKMKVKYQDNLELITVGKEAIRIAERNKVNVNKSFNALTGQLKSNTLNEITEIVTSEFLAGKVESVSILFNSFFSIMNYITKNVVVLPLHVSLYNDYFEIDEDKIFNGSKTDLTYYPYKLEPDEESVLDKLLPELFFTTLEHFALESLATEHSARMVAMQQASDNASRLQDKLLYDYNKARQAAVTQEITEIVNTTLAVS